MGEHLRGRQQGTPTHVVGTFLADHDGRRVQVAGCDVGMIEELITRNPSAPITRPPDPPPTADRPPARFGKYRAPPDPGAHPGTQAGLAAARRAGRTGGHQPKLTDDDIEAAKAPLANPDIAVTQIAHRLGVSPATLYRYIPAARTANTPGV